MRPLAQMPAQVRSGIRALLADIDGTMTANGLMPAKSYAALEDLQHAGIVVVPITGRPAGWCDMIARMWPVDAVVGENGAVVMSYDRTKRRMRRKLARSAEQLANDRVKLAAVGERILRLVPGCAIASDQNWRLTDLAIDFAEDAGPLQLADARKIARVFAEHGATAKISSIHVNGWFGEHDKLDAARKHLPACAGIDIDADNETVMFVGDSPNDEPLFSHFANSVGVANVREFAMKRLPAWVTNGRAADGFCEVARMLLDGR